MHSRYYDNSPRCEAVVWAYSATICCISRDQPVRSIMKNHCYSGLRAEGAVIEHILANKQRFIGTIEAGTEHRIMQWNVTGLCGATRAEELINVWGPAGVICTFCRRSRLTYQSSHCTKRRANVLLNCASPGHKTLKRHYSQNECFCHFALAPPRNTHTHTHTLIVRYKPSTMSTSCDPADVSLCVPCFQG